MDLLGIRKQFIEYSGRYDLVVDTTDYEDNGADFFITEAIRELDRDRFQHDHSEAVKYTTLKAGDYIAQITKARVLNSVYYGNGEQFVPLTYRYYDELRADYAKSLKAVDSGGPLYWRPLNLRHSPNLNRIESDTLEAISAYVDVATANYDEYDGVLVLPPPESDITLELHGLFYSDALVTDDDTNYWTMQEPTVLIMAGMRELERSYRNLTGANEWTANIQQKLEGKDLDLVAAQSSKFDQMRG